MNARSFFGAPPQDFLGAIARVVIKWHEGSGPGRGISRGITGGIKTSVKVVARDLDQRVPSKPVGISKSAASADGHYLYAS
jgi:hypothetical protein